MQKHLIDKLYITIHFLDIFLFILLSYFSIFYPIFSKKFPKLFIYLFSEIFDKVLSAFFYTLLPILFASSDNLSKVEFFF